MGGVEAGDREEMEDREAFEEVAGDVDDDEVLLKNWRLLLEDDPVVLVLVVVVTRGSDACSIDIQNSFGQIKSSMLKKHK